MILIFVKVFHVSLFTMLNNPYPILYKIFWLYLVNYFTVNNLRLSNLTFVVKSFIQ